MVAHFPQIFTILDIILETFSCKTFILQPSFIPFKYQSGQYLTINNDVEQPLSSRSYSLSSAPWQDHVSITVKRIDNGYMSRWLIDKAKIGDTMRVIGVFGHFVLPPDIDETHFYFFAAGSGITPIFSLIKQLLHDHPQQHISLFYSNKSKKDTIFYEELTLLQSLHPEHFNIQYYFSQENRIKNARLSPFMIPDLLAAVRAKNVRVYVCGPIEYMDNIVISAKTYGIGTEHIFTETFQFGIEPEEERGEILPPPDTESHEVSIRIANVVHKIRVQYPDSILDVGLQNHLPLPYSCGSGQCGNCTAQLISGKVWMGYNAVLTDADIQMGKVLTCLGYPIGGDVTISFE